MAQDHAGFDEFVSARAGSLYRSAYLLAGDPHAAQDLVQTALLKVLPKWGDIRSEPEAYVRRVMYNEHVSWWRRRRHVHEHLSGDVPEAPTVEPAPAEAAASRLDLQSALRQLTAKQRAILVLRYYEDLTEAQTAEVLGCAVGTVKRQSHVALARLRTIAPGLQLDPTGASS
ncbi:SigE family RNA polymerase sigma factor [Motilibacter deserti]|uniref:SigE family RNA polymerase sigma factor n=1 Tax=Motilibacter deserti TaxID=2714956 RepID=A0ABX0GZE4_9ACTN|nr:SigE family RNA polymerase sigma factor [Motilibacter deserti]NHC16324.1 SigE family RNA polymerase sigma factor [Motilibacter deserti]